ncbi:Nucleic-acid-binding protein from transposon X-element [Eumeta japonica]|uniref:Nucleic-acid-binding protein from transposon X-element n=1 Tax=Eumeta variegata TaxID=151549 RepID=A0A4C1WGI0_EUMVA|nr:Nucleic-acid-binding protein from transposon X-element [Eumeta japonica]
MVAIFDPAPSYKPEAVLGSIAAAVVEEFKSSDHCYAPVDRLLPDHLHYHSIPALLMECCRGSDIPSQKTSRAGRRFENRANLRRVVLRGVPREIPIDEVKEDLRSQNLPMQSVRRILNRSSEPLDLVLISGTAEANDRATKATFFQIRSVCFLSGIKAEQLRKRALPGQCHNCQSYGHSSRHCFNPACCVKCLGNHGTAQCTRNKDRDGLPACVLCKQKGHTANYLGCPRAPKRAALPRSPTRAVSSTLSDARAAAGPRSVSPAVKQIRRLPQMI